VLSFREFKGRLKKSFQVLTNSGYSEHGASYVKKALQGWITSIGSTKTDIDDNLETLRERSRDLYMGGASIATGALKTIRTNVIGSGLRVTPAIDYEAIGMTAVEADKFRKNIEREFNLWADTPACDYQRMNNFYELQQLAFISWLMSGEVFVLLPEKARPNMPYDLRVMVIEADRISTPPTKAMKDRIVNGVETDRSGEVVAYHISNKHPGDDNYSKSPKWKRVLKYGKQTGRPIVLHLMEAERPEQRRGVPILSPVIEDLKQLGRYTEAELMASVISSMFTVFIKSDNPELDSALGSFGYDEDDPISEELPEYKLGAGAIVALGEGEDIKEVNPGRQNTAFDGFVAAICKQIGVALELPFEVLVKHFTSSYSASRAALLEAWKMYKMRRTWMVNDYCQPIYEEWFTEGVTKGRINAPGFFDDPIIRKAYCKATWTGPTQGQLDPLKEVRAAERRVRNGFSTRSQETIEMTGGDYYDNVSRLQREEEELKKIQGGEANA
jgi:lambda family phage portal protein